MTDSATAVADYSDRILLPFFYDVDRMKSEVEHLQMKDYLYYDVVMLRGPAHLVDPNLPAPDLSEAEFADGSWTEWVDTPELKQSPYLMEIVDGFREHTQVNLVRLLRLGAGEVVKEHTDPTLALHIPRSVIRLTIPIQSDPGVEFYLNDVVVDMEAGECWYMRLSDPHKIINNSDRERVNLTIDMIPNDWVRETIASTEFY